MMEANHASELMRTEQALWTAVGSPWIAVIPLPLLLREAGLTPAQRTAVKNILDSGREAISELLERFHRARAALARLFYEPQEPVESDLAAAIEALVAIQEGILRQSLADAFAIRRLLTRLQLAQGERRDRELTALQALLHKKLDGRRGRLDAEAPD